MFALKEKVIYPGHGVAEISRVIEKKVANVATLFYELTFISKDMTILVPVNNSESAGIRSLSSKEHIQEVLNLFSEPLKRVQNYEFTASNWNKRNKEYQNKLRIGSMQGLFEIYRDLTFISTYKELSFGEKNLFLQAENLLSEEISLVKSIDKKTIEEELKSLCAIVRHLNVVKEYR